MANLHFQNVKRNRIEISNMRQTNSKVCKKIQWEFSKFENNRMQAFKMWKENWIWTLEIQKASHLDFRKCPYTFKNNNLKRFRQENKKKIDIWIISQFCSWLTNFKKHSQNKISIMFQCFLTNRFEKKNCKIKFI